MDIISDGAPTDMKIPKGLTVTALISIIIYKKNRAEILFNFAYTLIVSGQTGKIMLAFCGNIFCMLINYVFQCQASFHQK